MKLSLLRTSITYKKILALSAIQTEQMRYLDRSKLKTISMTSRTMTKTSILRNYPFKKTMKPVNKDKFKKKESAMQEKLWNLINLKLKKELLIVYDKQTQFKRAIQGQQKLARGPPLI